TSAITAMTTSASSSVKPGDRSPASNILRLAGPAGLLIRSVAEDVDFAVLSRNLVEVGLAPGILQPAVLLEIRTIPADFVLRRGDQRRQTLLRRRIMADVEAVQFQRRHDVLNLDLCRLGARLAEELDHLWRHDGCQQAEDRQHHKQFEECEAGLAA